MTSIITLTQLDGTALYINPANIYTIIPISNSRSVVESTAGIKYTVATPAVSILQLIDTANNTEVYRTQEVTSI